LLFLIASACKEKDNKINPAIKLPELTTEAIGNITLNSATSGGSIISDGGATVTTRGVCWSTQQPPTI